MNLIKAFATKNNCYKAKEKLIPKGIIVHSTGSDNPRLGRYVDSPEVAPVSSKHWNTALPDGRQVCVHGFIGYDKYNNVRFAQILPFDIQAWGCGSGEHGSYNDTHIQFEICEDGLKDRVYFTKAFDVAKQFCADMCIQYHIPVSEIVSHHEAHEKGYASNHGDCDHWLAKFGERMDDFRKEVQAMVDKKSSRPAPTTVPNGVQYIVTSTINVRELPSLRARLVATYLKGMVVRVIEIRNGWGKTPKGWVSMKFLEKK